MKICAWAYLSHSIGQNEVKCPYLTARQAGKCSLGMWWEEEEKDSGEQKVISTISIWCKLSQFSSSIFFSPGSYSFLSWKLNVIHALPYSFRTIASHSSLLWFELYNIFSIKNIQCFISSDFFKSDFTQHFLQK